MDNKDEYKMRLRQQKREYYYRNKESIRQKQKIYQASQCGQANIRKAKAKYFQGKIKKANGGSETGAHTRAKRVYYHKCTLRKINDMQ